MKSLHLLHKSPNPAFFNNHLRKGFAAVFAAAMVLGLGAESLMAQGPYYPQAAAGTGSPFEPNGTPVVNSPSLLAIEGKLAATKTLILPAPLGKTAATAAEYAAAVQAVATDLANGVVVPGGVTLASLAADVAKFRSAGWQGGAPQVQAGLEAIAAGVIASGSGTKVAQLTSAIEAVAEVNPAAFAGQDLKLFLAKVAADTALVADVKTLVAAALVKAVTTPVGMSVVDSSAVALLFSNAALAVPAGPSKKALVEGIATAGVAALVGAPALNSPSNIELATNALVNPALLIDLNDMIVKIVAAAGASDVTAGAIAQGALRYTGYRNAVSYGVIKAAVGAGAYATDLVDSYDTFNTSGAGAAAGLVGGGKDPVAVAAAGAARWSGAAGVIVKDTLTAAAPGAGATAQAIVARAAAAAGTTTAALQIATINGAGFGGATPADIAAGVITGGPIGAAGGAAKAVILAAGLTPANATAIGGAAITAATAVSLANAQDAYADIAYNLGSALKLPGAVGNARSSAAVTAMVNAIGAGGATYIPVIAALAGNLNQNAADIKSAGLAADLAVNAGANATPINEGAALIPLILNAYNPLGNYSATLSALSTPGTNARNLAVLYAASLANSSDAVGGLAAAIAKTGTSVADLTKAAISANRNLQQNLSLAGEVAAFTKLNGAGTNIQAYIGGKIVSNPTLVSDIATAGTVVLPQFSHVIAHTAGFNAPQQAYQAIAGIINHSKITFTTGTAGVDKLALGNRPSAIAAISAGVTTGILESRDLSASAKQFALRDAVRSVVIAVVGATYNDVSAGAGSFRRSNGLPAGFTLGPATGVAGAVTGFVAQMAPPVGSATPYDVSTDLQMALAAIKAASAVTLHVEQAQAAAQAFAWVTGGSGVQLAGAAAAISTAFGGTASVTNAVNFGISEAIAGTPGAGAGGLSNIPGSFYLHNRASGTPVSNIFSL